MVKKIGVPPKNYHFKGYWRCEVANASGFFSCETRAVSRARALSNIRFKICQARNLFFKKRPLRLEIYSYTLEEIKTPAPPPMAP